MLNEYFIVAHSFAAPFVSDISKAWWNGISPEDALLAFVSDYNHPCGLFCAYLYKDANAESRNDEALAKWHSNAVINAQDYVEGRVLNPKEGKLIK